MTLHGYEPLDKVPAHQVIYKAAKDVLSVEDRKKSYKNGGADLQCLGARFSGVQSKGWIAVVSYTDSHAGRHAGIETPLYRTKDNHYFVILPDVAGSAEKAVMLT